MQLRNFSTVDSHQARAPLRCLMLAVVLVFLPACRSAPFGGLGESNPEDPMTLADGDTAATDKPASDTPATDGDADTTHTSDTDADAAESAGAQSRPPSVAETVRSARERIGSWDEQTKTTSAVDFSNGGWRRAIATASDDPWVASSSPGPAPEPRWRNVAVDDWLATSPARRADVRHLLVDENPTVRGNAAIALARAGEADGPALAELEATVGRISTKLPLRQAAAESFAWVASPDAVGRLVDLIDEFSSVAANQGSQSAPQTGRSDDLHAELLRALAAHVKVDDEPRFTSALDSRSPVVLIDTLNAWGERHRATPTAQTAPARSLPVQILSLGNHPMPKVRSRALHALAAHGHPQAVERLVVALDDRDWMVRRAAIHSLAVSASAEAIAQLEQLLDDTGEIVRAEAVTALAHTHAWQVTDQAKGDKSRRVREALAASLARRRDPAAVATAENLVADRAVTVQAATLRATHDWPDNMAGSVLIGGLASRASATRRTSRDELLRRLPTAETSIHAVESTVNDSARCQAALDELRQRWRDEFGDAHTFAQQAGDGAFDRDTAGESVPAQLVRDADELLNRWVAAQQHGEPVEPLVTAWTGLASGPLVVAALESLVSRQGRSLPDGLYEQVLPRLDSTFELLVHLEASDPQERRVAAGELRNRAAAGRLSPLLVTRLSQTLVYERDALVWQSVLTAIENQHTGDAMTLASVALRHDQPMVRRQACEHIARAVDRRHGHLLVDALTDTDQSVRRAALAGLAYPRSVDDITPLLRFLSDTDVTMRFTAARTLTVIGSPEGVAALERMAHHDDANVRRLVAAVMGEFARETFVPTLIGMLDDESRVQRAVLASLPRCVGDAAPTDVHARDISQAALIGVWQDWWAESSHRGEASLRAARR